MSDLKSETELERLRSAVAWQKETIAERDKRIRGLTQRALKAEGELQQLQYTFDHMDEPISDLQSDLREAQELLYRYLISHDAIWRDSLDKNNMVSNSQLQCQCQLCLAARKYLGKKE
jgi:chromosome segregation ATPase